VSYLTVPNMSSESLAVFHHREAWQEASYDWGLCSDGYLQCWNHINPNFTGVCFFVCVRVGLCLCVRGGVEIERIRLGE